MLNRAYHALHDRFHRARADLFIRLMQPRPGARVLDLGGHTGALIERVTKQVPLAVTVAEVDPTTEAGTRARGFDFRLLDGSERLPFADGEFDVVFCNSVIEHVTLPRERCHMSQHVDDDEWLRESDRAQSIFAREIRRVGRGWFVQTPHARFPVEQHTLLPFVNFLTQRQTCRVVSWTERFWFRTCGGYVDWRLLDVDDMRRLFPDGTIHVERVLGLPKSIVAYRG